MRIIDLMDQDLILTIRSNSLKPTHSMRQKNPKIKQETHSFFMRAIGKRGKGEPKNFKG